MADLGYPVGWEADVLLRDGHPVHLRPIVPNDAEGLRAFHSSLSERTVYFRYLAAKPDLSDQDLAYLTSVDHVGRVALIALDGRAISGVGRFDAIGDGGAEVAFVIRDDMQGLGLGSVLLEHLAAAARERSITRFVAEVLPQNGRMLATFQEAGFEVDTRRQDGILHVKFAIEPTESSRSVMSAREHRAESRSVQRLLQPRTVAVVGASRQPGGLGHELLRHLVEGGFHGSLFAVHTEVDVIEGVRCVRSLADVEEPIDLAIVVVPAERVAMVIEDAAAARVHGLVVVSGGFGDSGPEGLQMQAALVDLVHRTGMRLVGPNALGLINTHPSVRLNASLVPQMPKAGRVGFFSQSGALGGAILERFRQQGLGVSTFVSAGNRADISGNDLLQYWEEDDATDLAVLYLETIGNAPKFARIVHRMSSVKPVIMVRTGGSGLRHPLGHSVAATLLSQRAVDQILADCGLIVVDSVDQLIDVARLIVGQPLPTTSAIAIVGNSDAIAVLAENALSRTVLTIARPAVTFAREESAGAYRSAINSAFEDPMVGAVLAIYVPPIEQSDDADIRAALRDCMDVTAGHGKPLVAMMLNEPGRSAPDDVPAFADVDAALQALSAAARHSQWRHTDARRREPAAEALADMDVDAISVRDADSGILGCRIRLLTDSLLGPVVSVGVDDPVAETLDDRSYRLAPVTTTAAMGMLTNLGTLSVLVEKHDNASALLDGLANAISQVSQLPSSGISNADLRHASVEQGSLTVSDVFVSVAEGVTAPEPLARRL